MRPDAEEPQRVNPHAISPVQPITPGLSSTLFNHTLSTPAGTPQAREINPHGSVGPNGPMPWKYVGGSSTGPKAAVNPFSWGSSVGESPFDAGQTASAFDEVTARSASSGEGKPFGDQDDDDSAKPEADDALAEDAL